MAPLNARAALILNTLRGKTSGGNNQFNKRLMPAWKLNLRHLLQVEKVSGLTPDPKGMNRLQKLLHVAGVALTF